MHQSDPARTAPQVQSIQDALLLVAAWCSPKRVVLTVLAMSMSLNVILLYRDASFDIYRSVLDQPQSLTSSASINSNSYSSNSDNSPIQSIQPRQGESTVHVLYGLAGQHQGFMSEFQISLKSVLMNHPIHHHLTIHIMATQAAYDNVHEFLELTLATWNKTFRQISIQLYNVEEFVPKWRTYISQQVFRDDGESKRGIFGHTIGSYFRLFCHQILPNDVEYVLYMDTDVVLTARLDELWRQIPIDPTTQNSNDNLFYWGSEIGCSGFVVLHVAKLHKFWSLVQDIFHPHPTNPEQHQNATKTMSDWAHELDNFKNDQLLFRAIYKVHPELVGILPPAWDSSLAALWDKPPLQIYRRKGVGMMHFNGGGSSKTNAFQSKNDYLASPSRHQYGWGLANYYVRIPWAWVRFIVESHVGKTSYNLTINYIPGIQNSTTQILGRKL